MKYTSIRSLVRRAAALGILLVLSGCASFERTWTAHRVEGHDAFTGRWEGKWTSAKHHTASGAASGGRLRCILTKQDARHYEAQFRANWLSFASSYTVPLQAERHGGELRIRGEHNLGALLGVYKYDGRVTPAHFHASYDSSYDRGAFEMVRP